MAKRCACFETRKTLGRFRGPRAALKIANERGTCQKHWYSRVLEILNSSTGPLMRNTFLFFIKAG